jgi:citronellol/citronellal dehydrogenase
MSNRLPLQPPKEWGMTDHELATWPLSFRDDAWRARYAWSLGGGSGMGRAIAYVLTRLGAQVIICGRRPDKLEETAAGYRRSTWARPS